MGNCYVLAILLGIALFLSTGQCNGSCRRPDGEPGVKGIPGRDGLHGAKGEKGEPAVLPDGPVEPSILTELKGEPGSRGPQGDIGPEGYPGEQGTMGQPGPPGRPGPDGRSQGGDQSAQQAHSAFSVIRTETSYPQYGQPVTYQKVVVNKAGDFDKDTGYFTCKFAGVYYFTFHSMAKTSMCLRIASDALDQNKQPGFCDYYKNNEQVLSGGVVIRLTRGQRVWLKSFRDLQTSTSDVREKQIIFNGFLIFSDE